MNVRVVVATFVLYLFGSHALATTFGTPQEAVSALEKAYADRDIDAAVNARDFEEEARRMLLRLNPTFATDASLLRETAEVLELGYRNEAAATFRRWKGVTCSIDRVTTLEEKLVLVEETCSRKGKVLSVEKVHVANTKLGWRVIAIPK